MRRSLGVFAVLAFLGVCQATRHYDYFNSYDQENPPNNIKQGPTPVDATTYNKMCDETPGCMCYNTNGWLKSDCSNMQQSGFIGASSLYVTTETIPPTPAADEIDGLSDGSLFIILTLSFFAAYLLFGVVYKSKVKGTTGTESVPNIDFWRVFPGYVSEGCKFSARKLKGLFGGPNAEFDEL